MLDPWIIEEIRKREKRDNRPRVEPPEPPMIRPEETPEATPADKQRRGVTIIDI